jgi:hypothetical protein
VREQQRQQMGLITVLLPETGLHLGAGKQKLLATGEVGLRLGSIVLLGTGALRALVHLGL